MAQYVNERQFWAGDHLHRSDERINDLFVVVEGRVTVSGGEYGKGTVGPSEAVGLLSLLASSHPLACKWLETKRKGHIFELRVCQSLLLE